MRRVVLAMIAAGLTASAAMATNINISVQQSNGTNAITVAPGDTVDYKVIGTLTDDVNEGLALIGLNLDFTGGPMTPANSPSGSDFTCTNPMRNFVIPEGVTNPGPGPGAFGGTVIVGAPCPNPLRACLVQAGGAQNTIRNTADNASFPIGSVLIGVAKPGGCGQAVLLTGSLTVPLGTPTGDYFLNAFDVFANVISDGETGVGFYASEAAGVGSVTNLTVNVGCTAAVPTVTLWESVATHGAVGEVGLVIPDTGLFSEPRSGIKKIVVTFSDPIDPTTASAGTIGLAGRKVDGSLLNLSGISAATAVTASNTKLEITFSQVLPDYAKYRVTLNGLENTCGAAVVTGTQRILTALRGDAAIGGSGGRVINSADVGGARSLINTDPINPANINHVRSDAVTNGKIDSADVGGIRSVLGRDATGIADP
jgi:hypothetical protein